MLFSIWETLKSLWGLIRLNYATDQQLRSWGFRF
jgi:hypothetical protein